MLKSIITLSSSSRPWPGMSTPIEDFTPQTLSDLRRACTGGSGQEKPHTEDSILTWTSNRLEISQVQLMLVANNNVQSIDQKWAKWGQCCGFV